MRDLMVYVALTREGKLVAVATSVDACKVACFDAGLAMCNVTILSQPLVIDSGFWQEVRNA